MGLLEIHVLGSPVLRQETQKVTEVTDEIRRLAADMFDTMYAARGIGLAAPQVGRLERLAVIDVDGNTPMTLVNPEIVHRVVETAKAEEGCLSIPDIYADVERSARVTVAATDLEGNAIRLEADGLLARCLQHEIDHLHGKLFIDYLGLFKRRSVTAKWEEEKAKYPRFLRTLSAEDIARQHVGHDDTL